MVENPAIPIIVEKIHKPIASGAKQLLKLARPPPDRILRHWDLMTEVAFGTDLRQTVIYTFE